jgi:hypothetical protein
LEEVQTFFTRYDDLLASEQWEPTDLDVLRSSIAEAHRTYQAARYQEVIGWLPVILAEADHAVRSGVASPDDLVAQRVTL